MFSTVFRAFMSFLCEPDFSIFRPKRTISIEGRWKYGWHTSKLWPRHFLSKEIVRFDLNSRKRSDTRKAEFLKQNVPFFHNESEKTVLRSSSDTIWVSPKLVQQRKPTSFSRGQMVYQSSYWKELRLYLEIKQFEPWVVWREENKFGFHMKKKLLV